MIIGLRANGKILHDTTRSCVSGILEESGSHLRPSRTRPGPGSVPLLPFLYPAICGANRSRGDSARTGPRLPFTPRARWQVRRLHSDRNTTRDPAITKTADRPPTPQDQPLILDDLLRVDRVKTQEEKQLIWRAWLGLSDDLQATRLQLLESLLEMLQTEDVQDARRLRALLDSKHGLIDAQQRPFYSFWAHMHLQEPDIALRHYQVLPQTAQMEHWQTFMRKIVETGDWATGIKLWYMVCHTREWHGHSSIRALLDLVPNLYTWQFLSVLPSDAARELRAETTSALLIHISAKDQSDRVTQFVKDAINLGTRLTDASVASAIACLDRAAQESAAVELYHEVCVSNSCPPRSKRARMTLACLNAAANLVDTTALRSLLHDGALDILESGKGIRIIEPYTTAMSALARQGQVKEVTDLFEEYLSKGHSPDVIMLSAVVHVRVMTLEISEARFFFNSCEDKYGIKPDQVLHNILLHGFADTLDTQGATNIILAMLEDGFEADPFTASTLIDLFAHTKDADGAENAFKRMVELGVRPNVEVYGSLLHAYIEADDTERVQQAFRDFQASGLKPNSEIMNILLKQLRKEGRSYQEMDELVRNMATLNVFPTNATYTQLMRVLINENNMPAALDLFQSLKRPNVYHYTVLMVGFLRVNTSESMDSLIDYYNQLLERGLKPTFITLAVLMNAFVIRNSPGFLKQANELLDSLSTWSTVDLTSKFPPRTIPSPAIYSPLIRRRKRGPVELVNPKKIFKMFLNGIAGTDGRPDIRILTSIMSVYATTNQVERVRSIFVAIKKESDRLYRYTLAPVLSSSSGDTFVTNTDEGDSATNSLAMPSLPEVGIPPRPEPGRALALPARKDGSVTQVSRGARYILAAPLSIFTKAMVRAERYDEIERVWAALARQGYEFDTANWNQYVQTQIDRGEIERACHLISNNLLSTDVGARIYKRTKFRLLAAFEVLRNGRVEASGDPETTTRTEKGKEKRTRGTVGGGGEQEGSKVWARIVRSHGDVLRALEA